MQTHISQLITQATAATSIESSQLIQSLWSGYGEVVRLQLHGASTPSVILKHVCPPSEINHPRGWHSNISHQRKIKSYAIEQYWYQNHSLQCHANMRVAHCYAAKQIGDEFVLLLEDLDAAGFDIRKDDLCIEDIHACLHWLAHFHARFLNTDHAGLWQYGSYWHLETRPDEWQAMLNEDLKQAAQYIDQTLNQCQFKTLLHGDAKAANFCFSQNNGQVAAVDFQYVGAGCGMKDIAYFFSSCLSQQQCQAWEDELLYIYFNTLNKALKQYHPTVDVQALEAEWRELYAFAWADFYRFLDGWMPGHWKINAHTQRLTNKVLMKYQTGIKG